MKFVRFAFAIVLCITIAVITASQQNSKEVTNEYSDFGVYIFISSDYSFLEPEPEQEPIFELPEILPSLPIPLPQLPNSGELSRPRLTAPGLLGIFPGDRLYIRIFKRERKLEIWYQRGRAPYRWLKSYEICNYSGGLGPKKLMGDLKSPEGFYSTNRGRLNPHSNFHLSFNIGYPNQYDRAHGYTGDFLMIHGDCVSTGCYAMTNDGIEEIYGLVEYALNHGQREIPIHIFPFAMTEKNLSDHQNSNYIEFWRELKPAYDIFQQQRRVPRVTVRDRRYVIE